MIEHLDVLIVDAGISGWLGPFTFDPQTVPPVSMQGGADMTYQRAQRI